MDEALTEQAESEDGRVSRAEQGSRNGLEREVQTKVLKSERDGVPLFLGFFYRGWCDGFREHVQSTVVWLWVGEWPYMLFPKMKCGRQALSLGPRFLPFQNDRRSDVGRSHFLLKPR